MALLERGIACAKLFPAEVVGGVAMARALAGPFPDVRAVPDRRDRRRARARLPAAAERRLRRRQLDRRRPARERRRPRARDRPRPRRGRAAHAMSAAALLDRAPAPERRRRPVAPTTLVVFGATGDLAQRKLFPALYNLALRRRAAAERFALVGGSRSQLSDDEFRALAADAVRRHSRRPPDEALLERLLADVRYVAGAFDGAGPVRRACAQRARRAGAARASGRPTAPSTSRPRRSCCRRSSPASAPASCRSGRAPRCGS